MADEAGKNNNQGDKRASKEMKKEIIFVRNGWRYTAYINALLELSSRRSIYVPSVEDLGWYKFVWIPLPGGVKMALKGPERWGADSGPIYKILSLIIRQNWRNVKCGQMIR